MKMQKIFPVLWIAFAVLSRLIPHPANVSPMTSLCLFSGSRFSKKTSFLLAFISLVLSDMVLSQFLGYPIFGRWSLFTYTGFFAIVYFGRFLTASPKAGKTIVFLLSSSLGFWLWTNFGTWFAEGLYPRTTAGLFQCYLAAIPFLKNALIGDLVWGGILFVSFHYAQKYLPTTDSAVTSSKNA